MSFILHVTVAVQHAGRGLLQVGAVERSRALVPAGPDCQSRSYSGSPHLRQTAHAHRNSILYFIDCLVLLHQTASLIASSCFPFPFLLPFLKLRYRLFSFFFFSDRWINWIEFFFNVFFFVFRFDLHRTVWRKLRNCSCAPKVWHPVIRTSTNITVSGLFICIPCLNSINQRSGPINSAPPKYIKYFYKISNESTNTDYWAVGEHLSH